jgi:hypothetical protein
MSDMKFSPYATDWGTWSPINSKSLGIVITILNNHQLELNGWSKDFSCSAPDEHEIMEADAVVSVLAMLRDALVDQKRIEIVS